MLSTIAKTGRTVLACSIVSALAGGTAMARTAPGFMEQAGFRTHSYKKLVAPSTEARRLPMAAPATSVSSPATITTAGVCPPGTQANALFTDHMDAGKGSWSAAPSKGPNKFSWTAGGAFGGSGSNWVAKDFKTGTDERLRSPRIALPIGENPITLSFQSYRNYPNNCKDGSFLDISVDGGTTFSPIAEADIFVDSYNGTINASTNPLNGASAWCGGGSGFTQTKVDLSSYAGHNVYVRFHLGTDDLKGNDGWHIDEVKVDVCGIVPDTDLDGIPDASDNCPLVSNVDQADLDEDGIGDACDPDNDNDGVPDLIDNCPTTLGPEYCYTCTPQVLDSNPDQTNSDGDSLGNVCDPDDDNDTVLDGNDNCPLDANTTQIDTDHDGQGDACDTDDDNDTVPDATDNCPLVINLDQANLDGDAFGDACDDDEDGDGVINGVDNCPVAVNPLQEDSDGDGIGNVCDTCPNDPSAACDTVFRNGFEP